MIGYSKTRKSSRICAKTQLLFVLKNKILNRFHKTIKQIFKPFLWISCIHVKENADPWHSIANRLKRQSISISKLRRKVNQTKFYDCFWNIIFIYFPMKKNAVHIINMTLICERDSTETTTITHHNTSRMKDRFWNCSWYPWFYFN